MAITHQDGVGHSVTTEDGCETHLDSVAFLVLASWRSQGEHGVVAQNSQWMKAATAGVTYVPGLYTIKGERTKETLSSASRHL